MNRSNIQPNKTNRRLEAMLDIMKFLVGVLVLVLMVLWSTSCSDKHDDDLKDATSSRTVLVYMVAENSLASYSTYSGERMSDIDEMIAGAAYLSDNDRLVIYLDDTGAPRIYVLTNKTKAQSYADLVPAYQYAEDSNSASPQQLAAVMDYTVKHCKADEYGLVLWSHGSGWIPSTDDASEAKGARGSRKSFGVDNGLNVSSGTYANRGPQMNIDEMGAALSRFQQFEFILFDACFMQCMEVAYDLRHCTKYLMGSPAEIPAYGAPYQDIARPMFADTLDIAGMVEAYSAYYQTYMGSVLSVVDCAQVDALADITRRMVQTYRDELLELDYDAVQDYFSYDRWHRYINFPDFYDMRGIMYRALPAEAYEQWLEQFCLTVPIRSTTATWFSAYPQSYMVNDVENYGGVTMFVPLQKYADEEESFYDAYFATAWAKAVWM